VLRDDARSIVGDRATRWNKSTVSEGTRCSDQAFAAIHSERAWVAVFLWLRVQFDLHGIGIDVIKKNLDVEYIFLSLLLDGRGPESQR